MVVVTGARGNVGRALVGELVEEGVEVRAVSREPQGPHGVAGDLTQPGSLARALEGAEALFLPIMAGDVSRRVDLAAVTSLAARAGVQRVVLVSSMIAQTDPDSPLGRGLLHSEQIVRESGLSWTLLRPWEFASNVMAWLPGIRGEGRVRVPRWEQPSPAIHPADIASVARRALTGDHAGKIYPLTGPESLTARGKLLALEQVLGREIELVVQEEPVPGDLAGKLAVPGICGLSDPGARPTVQQVTGAPARRFAQWVQEHAGAIRAAIG